MTDAGGGLTTTTTTSDTPSPEVLAATTAFVDRREDRVGADQPSLTSWLPGVHPYVTSAMYARLQPRPDDPTGTPRGDFDIAHQRGYVVRAHPTNCIWDLQKPAPTPTSGWVYCDLTDTTVDAVTGAPVSQAVLDAHWTENGPQDPLIVAVVKNGDRWYVDEDATGQVD
ncbi:MAG: hypothetical protein JO086_12045 [Acidimicrobiia bacterium]|nr:hypothetical protein [Acidimicrobiia bacterium]